MPEDCPQPYLVQSLQCGHPAGWWIGHHNEPEQTPFCRAASHLHECLPGGPAALMPQNAHDEVGADAAPALPPTL